MLATTHDNTVLRNRFERYSDGLQINWGNRNTTRVSRSANLLSGNGLKIERCFAGGACAPGQPAGGDRRRALQRGRASAGDVRQQRLVQLSEHAGARKWRSN
ncbi:hypothetical protein NB693_25280 [Pantoea ananatis]|uniref:hypothetical protein n=1 Tax=Pantoea ananas TaxID=553 RepID=UPI00221F8416|nr:hypothetical protein [Pantoea ananatis]